MDVTKAVSLADHRPGLRGLKDAASLLIVLVEEAILRYLEALLIAAWLAAVVAGGPAFAQQTAQLPEAPPYRILPPTWPYPAFPTCYTPYGICRFPQDVAPGMPCVCLAANGVWVRGQITVNPLYPLRPNPSDPLPAPGR